MDHYCCHRILFPHTSSERVVETLNWFPVYDIKMPTASRKALIIAAAQELLAALTSPQLDSLLPPTETITRQNLQKLSQIFNAMAPPSPTTKPVSRSQPTQPSTAAQFPASLPRVTQHPASLPRVIPHHIALPRVPQGPPKVKATPTPMRPITTHPLTTYGAALDAFLKKIDTTKTILNPRETQEPAATPTPLLERKNSTKKDCGKSDHKTS